MGDPHGPAQAMTNDKADPRPEDPYRRRPGVIELGAGEFSRQTGADPAGPATGPAPNDEEPTTAIEPVAATGLDGARGDEPSSPPAASGPAIAASDRPAHDPIASSAEPASPGTRAPASADGAAPGRADASPRRGWGSLAAAAVMGGVLGAGLATAADRLLPRQGNDLAERVAAVEARSRLPAAPAAPAAPPDGDVTRRLLALEAGARTLAEGVSAARSTADTAAKGVAEAAARPAPAETAAPPLTPDPALRDALDANAVRLGALEKTVGSLPTADVVEKLAGQLTGQLEASGKRSDEQARSAVDAVQASVGSVGTRVAAVEGRIGSLSEEVAKLPPGVMAAGLRVVVAGQISDALRAGTPLGPSLAALEKLGAASADTEVLKRFASGPALSPGALLSEFRPVAERILAEPARAADSLGDRLLRIADKIVTVRAVGDGSGNDVPGLVGRIETGLGRGDALDAAATWERLPESARAVAPAWGERVKARAAADAAARRLAAESLAALQAPPR